MFSTSFDNVISSQFVPAGEKGKKAPADR